jgi:DNA-binding transcriptional LysR family regulator
MSPDQWFGVELRHLAALSAIAGAGSFRGAADRLGYVQSTVSEQLAVLERLVGGRLVERTRGTRPVAITPEGELMLHHAGEILARVAAAKADLGRLREGAAGNVRVGAFPSVVRRLMPRILEEFGRRCPEAEVTVGEWASDDPLFELVEEGRLDLAFAHLPLEPGPFAHCELLRVPLMLMVPADSPVALRGEPPGLPELARLPVIGGQTCRLLSRVEEMLRTVHGRLDVAFRSDSAETTAALVAAGKGVGLTSSLSPSKDDERIALVPLDGCIPPLRLALFWHKHRLLAPAAEELGEQARAVCRGFYQDDQTLV